MKSKLSKREKVLLFFLACVIIIAGSLKFLIIPSIEEMNEIQTQIDEAKNIEISMKSKIANQELVQSNISKTIEEINSLSEGFYPVLENNEIDSIITELLVANNLVPKSLFISTAADTIPSASDESSSADSSIKRCFVSVNVSGAFSDLSDLIAEVNKLEALRISSFNIDGSLGDTVGIVSISIDFEVFMYDGAQE